MFGIVLTALAFLATWVLLGWTMMTLGETIMLQQDLIQAVFELVGAVDALEAKPRTPGAQLVDQEVLDQAVSDLQAAKAKVDVETEAK